MNYYERLQESINYIEQNLLEPLEIEEIAKRAYMSKAVFYRIFFSIVGYTPKEYIRLRRTSKAAWMLNNNEKVLDVALACGYQSVDAFSRAFRVITGFLPEKFKLEKQSFLFERMDIMDQYFEVQDHELLERYPDIKVLKKIEPMRVASYAAYSRTPEDDAFGTVEQWAKSNGLMDGSYGYRIFGFDVGGSLKADGTYGFEVWMTVPANFESKDDIIKIKEFPGGLYAIKCKEREKHRPGYGSILSGDWGECCSSGMGRDTGMGKEKSSELERS